MNNQTIEKYILDTIQNIKNGESEEKIISSLHQENVGPRLVDRILVKANHRITEEYIDKTFDLINGKAGRKEVVQMLSQELSEDYVKMVLRQVELKYKENIRSKVMAAILVSNDYYGIIDSFKNDFISKEEIRNWIIGYYTIKNKEQKDQKKNELVKGLLITLFGILITWGTYMIAVSNGGGRYFLTYGLIIAGVITIFKSFGTTIEDIPYIQD